MSCGGVTPWGIDLIIQSSFVADKTQLKNLIDHIQGEENKLGQFLDQGI
jgi:hypothetical protein